MSSNKQPSISSRQFAIPTDGTNASISYDSSSSSIEESELDSSEENTVSPENIARKRKLKKSKAKGDSDNFTNFSAMDYLYETLDNAVTNNNGVLDKTLALQAQSSGLLTAKTMELQNLEKEVMNKLDLLRKVMDGEPKKDRSPRNKDSNTASQRSNGEEIQSFKELFATCQNNLLWSEKRLNKLFSKVSSEYPIEFNEAKNRVISREEYNEIDEEDLRILQRGM